MSELLPHILFALAAVIVVGRLLARLFAHIGQPPVIGEVVAGILLGPSLMGKELSALILPPDVGPMLGIIAQLGVILYMFLVGLELNADLLQARARTTLIISQAGMLAPLACGIVLALWLYPRLSDDSVLFSNFALFMGVAMSITAFPVLARILTDRGIDKTPLGVLALGSAAVGDVTAWYMLAFVVGVVQARMESAMLVGALALAYVALVFVLVKPVAQRLARHCESQAISPGVLAWVLVAVLLSALATEWIGIHAIFGAFLLGAVVPHESRLAREITRKLHGVVTVLLLPAFFAYTGMRTEIGLVAGRDLWLQCGIIIAVATVGKYGGTLAGARLTGLDWRTSSALGILMNTRGLMELIVLNIGLELKVISPTLFAMMVLMALATTMATTPLLNWLMAAGSEAATESPATSASVR